MDLNITGADGSQSVLTFSLMMHGRELGLDPAKVVRFTPEGFYNALLAHRSKPGSRRGPAGFADDEREAKIGPAIVPAIFDWTAPVCGCVDAKSKRTFADRMAERGDAFLGWRARHKHNVLRMSAAIFLDVDDMPEERVIASLDAMSRDGLAWVSWTTHSYGRVDKSGKMPCRVVVFCDREYPRELAEGVRRGLAARYGLVADEACFQPVTVFYLPSTPDHDGRAAMAKILRSDSFAHLVDPMTFVSVGEQARAERKARDATEREAKAAARADKAPLLAIPSADIVHTPITAAADQANAALLKLQEYKQAIASRRGEHVRALLLGAYHFGSYAAFGALDMKVAYDQICDGIKTRHEAVGECADDLDRRMRDATGAFLRGYANPAAPREENEAGVERLMDDLDLSLPERPRVRAADVSVELERLLNERAPGEVVVVAVTPGAGKTRAALEQVVHRARSGHKTEIRVPSHALATEQIGRLTSAGIETKRLRSAAAVIDGEPNCDESMLPVVRKAAGLGLNVREVVCAHCSLRRDCALFGKARGPADPAAFVAAHQLPSIALAKEKSAEAAAGRELALYIDEEPELHEKLEVSRDELMGDLDFTYVEGGGAESALLGDWSAPLATVELQDAVRRGHSERANLLTKRAQYDTFGLKKGVGYGALGHEPTIRTLRVLRAWRALATGFQLGEHAPTELVRELRVRGGAMLSATPRVAHWQRWGARIVRIDVQDGCEGIVRQVLYQPNAARRGVLPNKRPDMARVERVLADALTRARKAQVTRLLVVSYQALAEELRARLGAQWAGEWAVLHYGNTRGFNAFEHFDGCITLFDPWPDLEGDARERARGELAQAHGRLRDPVRSSPCWHLHVGSVAPLGWASDNAEVVRAKNGAPRGARASVFDVSKLFDKAS